MQVPGWFAQLAADPERETAMAAVADRLGLAYERRSQSNARDMNFQLFDTLVAANTTNILASLLLLGLLVALAFKQMADTGGWL